MPERPIFYDEDDQFALLAADLAKLSPPPPAVVSVVKPETESTPINVQLAETTVDQVTEVIPLQPINEPDVDPALSIHIDDRSVMSTGHEPAINRAEPKKALAQTTSRPKAFLPVEQFRAAAFQIAPDDLAQLKKVPRLGLEDQRELARQRLVISNPAERKVLDHLLLVSVVPAIRNLASRFRRQSLTDEDLFQEGVIGFFQGLASYDPERGVGLWEFCKYSVAREMRRAGQRDAELVRLPVNIEDGLAKLGRERAKYKTEHGREPTLDTLLTTGLSSSIVSDIHDSVRRWREQSERKGLVVTAEAQAVKETELRYQWLRRLMKLGRGGMVSLDAPRAGDEGTITLLDQLFAREGLSPNEPE